MLGDSVQQSKLEVLKAQTALFREKLEEFALSHRWPCCPWHPSPMRTCTSSGPQHLQE